VAAAAEAAADAADAADAAAHFLDADLMAASAAPASSAFAAQQLHRA
jgi:hypothetical protein